MKRPPDLGYLATLSKPKKMSESTSDLKKYKSELAQEIDSRKEYAAQYDNGRFEALDVVREKLE